MQSRNNKAVGLSLTVRFSFPSLFRLVLIYFFSYDTIKSAEISRAFKPAEQPLNHHRDRNDDDMDSLGQWRGGARGPFTPVYTGSNRPSALAPRVIVPPPAPASLPVPRMRRPPL